MSEVHTRMISDQLVAMASRLDPSNRVPEEAAIQTSSTMKGRIRAPAKGHPSKLPKANQKMPLAVLKPVSQSTKAAMPSMVVYMAKLDGKYAVDA